MTAHRPARAVATIAAEGLKLAVSPSTANQATMPRLLDAVEGQSAPLSPQALTARRNPERNAPRAQARA